jgi:RNA polymerase sigma factor (sigma-70 family)
MEVRVRRETESAAMNSLAVKDALRCLTTKQQQAVILRVEGYTYREIADDIGISRTSAWWRVSRATERMKDGER